MRDLIFISYSHKDKAWLERLQEHLNPLIPDIDLSVWDDTQIEPGDEFEKEIDRAIDLAKISILLVTEAFLESDFIRERELPRLVKDAKKKETILFWIAVEKVTYKHTALKDIQPANDPAAPLSSLGQDECQAILAEISRKITAAADAPERRRPLSYYVNYVPFAIIVAVAALLIAALAFADYSYMRAMPLAIPLILSGASVLWVVGIGLYAFESFGVNRPIPAPEAFWHLLFNKLATAVGRTERLQTKAKVLIISDINTKSIAHRIRQEYNGQYLEVKQFVCPSDFENKDSDLEELLNESQALYLFRTEATKKSKKLWKILNKWVDEDSHKPVFVVDFLPDDYQLPFTRIPEAQAVSGIWKLLAHGNERADLWRAQATTYRKFCFAAAGLLLAVLILLSLPLFQKKRELAVRNRLGEETLRDQLWVPLETASQTLKAPQPDGVRNALAHYAVYEFKDLLDRLNVPDTGRQLTFWRELAYDDGKNYTCIVAASSPRPLVCYPSEEDYLINCAIKHNQFVLWRRDFRNNDKAAWKRDGTANAHYEVGSGAISFEGPTPSKCSFHERPHTRTGILCLGIEGIPPSYDHHSGLCLSDSEEDSQTSQDFLSDEWTRHYLLRAISIMKLVPDEMLRTQEVLEAMRKSAEEHKAPR
ncbi:MAG TPA: toll/interleukin-1 receptor domain-containing protein [Pyrinomonadaceae bacterium]|jgi:hypothetical protein|nr:toll/interleukin-1 receptor domain-containing protein [Pyrinomonadaceae bacterium]